MRAIILAAGAGRRLGVDLPKSMLDVGGKSIIHRQIAAFQAVGVSEFVIVVGYAQDQLRQHLAALPGQFTFIVNERFAETNTIYSLYLARGHVAPACFYANADVVFDRRITERLAGSHAAGAMAVQAGRCAEEEVKVIVRNGRIVRISKQLIPADCLGEFVGVARFSGPVAPAMVASLSELVERENVVSDYFERAVDRICEAHDFVPVDVSDLPCREIDFPEDLDLARAQIAPQLVE